MIEEIGTRQDFRIELDGRIVAHIWHSDISEWSIETSNGSIYRRRTRDEAVSFAMLLAGVK